MFYKSENTGRRANVLARGNLCGFAGVHLTCDCRRMETALLALSEMTPGAEVTLLGHLAFDLPDEISVLFEALRKRFKSDPLLRAERSEPNAPNAVPSGAAVTEYAANSAANNAVTYAGPDICRDIDSLRFMLSSLIDEGLDELIRTTRFPRESVATATVSEPGLWFESEWGIRSLSLCDAILIAEKSEFSVIDALPNRDIAAGGTGGPILPLAQSVFLASPETDRLLVDLGQTVRLTFFPRQRTDPSDAAIFPPPESAQIDFEELIPGGTLLDAILQRGTDGRRQSDRNGRLAATGRPIPEALEALRKRAKTLRRQAEAEGWAFFSPNPLPIEPALDVLAHFWEGIDKKAQKKERTADLLATVCAWAADEILRATGSRFKRSRGKLEFVLTGSLLANRAFTPLIEPLIQSEQTLRLADLGLPDEAFDATAAALLGIFFINRTCGTLPHLTDAAHPVILGQLAPGKISPQNILPFRQFVEKLG